MYKLNMKILKLFKNKVNDESHQQQMQQLGDIQAKKVNQKHKINLLHQLI